MTTIKFNKNINAPKEKVWETLWNDETYRKWTEPFMEGSYAESDWEEGSKIQFLVPKGDGLFGVIEKKITNKQMTFKYLGEVKKGVEEPKDWGDAIESYYLEEEESGVTKLYVEMNVTDDMKDYFTEAFPKALDIVKQLAE